MFCSMEYASSEGEEKEEDEEPSALDYAHMHGLSKPYCDESPLTGYLPTPPRDDFDQDLWTPTPASITNTVSTLIRERLTVNRDAALLLQAVHELQGPPPQVILTSNLRQFTRRMKQELPILRTDNELDMLNIGSADMPDLTKPRIPSEVVNEKNDEGFEWPARFFTYPEKCEAQIKAERLAVSRNVLVYLQDIICDTYTLKDSEKLEDKCMSYEASNARRPVTPPLLPLSPVLAPYIPSSPTNRLPFLSDCSDTVTVEVNTLESQIMEADSLTRKSSDSSDSMLLDVTHPPQPGPLFEKRTSPILKRRAEGSKVEGPLTPPMLTSSPFKKLKSVSFSEILHHSIPDAPWVSTCGEDGEEIFESYFDEAFNDIEPLAREAVGKVENEQLLGADTTARVMIPHIDFTLPVAPWNEYSQRKGGKYRSDETELDAQMKFLLRVKREDLKTASSWHGVSSLTRELEWGIFTAKISKINVDEQLHGETEFHRMFADLTTGNIATSYAQVWKSEGLRILDAEEDEEGIEPAEMDEGRDMDTLVRKRKLEMEEEAIKVHCKRTPPPPNSITDNQQYREVLGSHHWIGATPTHHAPTKALSKTTTCQAQKSQAPLARHKSVQPLKQAVNELMFGGFSVKSALYKFMETRGKAVDTLGMKPDEGSQSSKDHRPHATTTLPVRSREPSLDHAVSCIQQRTTPTLDEKNRGEALSQSLPYLPPLPENLAPCSFIVSSAFLQQRSLTKQIEQLYTAAEIVYRDYDMPHSPIKEADILLSPSTGLVLTTLQQIKQRPLPGQSDRSTIRESLQALQLRHERLIVMISEGLSREMECQGSSRPNDPRDKEALKLFESFADQLEGEVFVRYICGGEKALANSIAIEMAKYCLAHGSRDIGKIKPLAVESTWEIFLRRAGLNPFAAQVVIAALQQPVNVHFSDTSSSPIYMGRPQAVLAHGMPAFLMMNEEERIRQFQALMGGSRILKRLSNALDQSWVSAAHGFRM